MKKAQEEEEEIAWKMLNDCWFGQKKWGVIISA